MLSEYIDMSNFLPALSSEVVLRVVEILKHFNTRTCQLVLGAHAMQVCAHLWQSVKQTCNLCIKSIHMVFLAFSIA